MKTFTVYEQPDPPGDRLDRAEALVFLPDGFSLAAALVPPLWMLGNAMWLAVAGYVAVIAVLGLLGALGLPAAVIGLCIVGLHIGIGFEAMSLRRWTLERQGWQSLGAVVGADLTDCERRFLTSWLPVTADRPAGGLPRAAVARSWWPFGRARPA